MIKEVQDFLDIEYMKVKLKTLGDKMKLEGIWYHAS